MQPIINLGARCIRLTRPADAATSATLSDLSVHTDESFSVAVPVTNRGGIAATNVSTTGHSRCTHDYRCIRRRRRLRPVGVVPIHCDLGTLGASAQATINMDLTASTPGSYSITGNVVSDADADGTNNDTAFTVNVVTAQAATPPVVTTPPATPAPVRWWWRRRRRAEYHSVAWACGALPSESARLTQSPNRSSVITWPCPSRRTDARLPCHF